MRSSNLVHISGSPTLSNAKMNWNITSLKISPAPGGIVTRPHVVQITIDSGLVVLIAVRSSSHALHGIDRGSTLVAQVPR